MSHKQYACGCCGEGWDDEGDALKCCPAKDWGNLKPYTREVSSCCGEEIGHSTTKEYPLGRHEPGVIWYEIAVCTECGEEVEE